MRLRRSSLGPTSFLVTLLPFTTAINLDCERARADGQTFDLSALGGPKTVIHTTGDVHPSYVETAFTVDICQPLKKTGPKGEDCPNGSRVCGIATLVNYVEQKNETFKVIPIAGDYSTSGAGGGGHFDPSWTRLSTSSIQSDREKEGIRLKMGGGSYPPKDGKRQKAVVEFLCDRKNETEGQKKAFSLRNAEEGDEEGNNNSGKSDEEKKAEEQTDDGEGGTLRFLSYDEVGEEEVLSLEWKTRHACEDTKDNGSKSSSGHWGFFTWFIIIFFLAVAAYLIFGSWLNYNRYSARGWDLVPHSETLRDIPYIFKDWVRRVVNTIQGGGSRGGYSAV
ncbi:MAG: hypothetical protein Q9195_003255 [Heterodermia aff. obscurata]